MAHNFESFSPARELTTIERGILEQLLASDFPGKSKLGAQLATAHVAAECRDCKTISLVVDRTPENSAKVKRRIPVEAEAIDADSVKIHLLLHVLEGFIVELETFREDGGNVQRIPEPEQLAVFSLDENPK